MDFAADIGTRAGEVWRALAANGPTGFKQLGKLAFGDEQIPMPDVILGMALGWLLREGKLNITTAGVGKGFRMNIALKEQQ